MKDPKNLIANDNDEVEIDDDYPTPEDYSLTIVGNNLTPEDYIDGITDEAGDFWGKVS